MNTVQCVSADGMSASFSGTLSLGAMKEETPQARVARLYAQEGGALMSWLFDECRQRGQPLQQMAREVGVTYGYINQLRAGIRQTANITQDVADAFARYLGVPTIVVKVVSGQIRMRDFAWPGQSEETLVERAFERMLTDPAVRPAMPGDARHLPFEAKKALVLLYSDGAGQDVLGLKYLPEVLQWLQRTVVIHDESEGKASRRKRQS